MQPISPQWLPSVSVSVPVPADRKRGFLLTAFLALATAGNVILASVLVLFAGAIAGAGHVDRGLDPAADAAAALANRLTLFLALIAAVNVAFLTGVWMWKKWGVYGYAMVSAIGMLAGMRVVPASAVTSLAWAFIVTTLIALKWRHFE